MDSKSENVLASSGSGASKKVETIRMQQIHSGSSLLKVVPKAQVSTTNAGTAVVAIAAQPNSVQNVTRNVTGTVIIPAQTKPLPTMLKRLPNNISVSAQSIIIQPEQSAPAASNFNLIPNQPVIVQPINVDMNRKPQLEPTSLLKQISSRSGENKVIVEKIGERPRTTVVVSTSANPILKQVVQVLNTTPTKKNEDAYIVNAMPSDRKCVVKLLPTEKQQKPHQQQAPRVVVTGQTIYKPIAPAPKPGQPAALKTVPTIHAKLPTQPAASTSAAVIAKKEKKIEPKVDKIFIVRNTQTGSTELLRGKH